jgi:uracil-DNA glycosylase family 4
VTRVDRIAALRNPKCRECRAHQNADAVCVMGRGNFKAPIMVVGRMPNSKEYQRTLEADLTEAGVNIGECYFTAAMKCRNFDISTGTTIIKACAHYLADEIAIVKPQWILTMGNEALTALTGKSGVMKYRGQTFARGDAKVIPTISPLSVARNPGQRGNYISDLNYFSSQVKGKGARIDPPKIHYIKTVESVKRLRRLLHRAELLAFDVETYSDPPGNEWVPNAQIVSLSGTMLVDGQVVVWALPLAHPQSPFRSSWRRILSFLRHALADRPKLIAHNGKYDCRWLSHFGVPMTVSFDTMLAVHLVNENVSKSLKNQCQMRFGVKPWAIDTKDLRRTPIDQVLEYNALDTYYDYHLYEDVKRELVEQPRLARLFKSLMTPANNILTGVEMRGVWMDREKLASAHHVALEMRARIDRKIMRHVPNLEEAEAEGYSSHGLGEMGWPCDSRGQPRAVNFNPSIFARWLLFEHLELPVLARGKEKQDGGPGDPSMAEDVLLELQQDPGHKVIDLLLERTKWQKYCSAFLSAYQELIDDNDRVHTTFKLYGTVTGRLSSGKAEQDKITARAPVRGVNLQQVPRDAFIRGLFGAAPGYTFVEADFSQVELRVVAFLSRDRTMMHLYQTEQDIHTATAAWVLGIPESQVSVSDRKKAKAVNFGFCYAMGASKFVYTAFTKYGVRFTLDEATDVRRAYFEQFPGLLPWHAKQRRLVAENRRVQSPLGRIRHLPDIDSADRRVRAEAERQAINSPVQSFASDMTMLSMILLHEKFAEKRIDGHFISTVHDALLFEIRDKHVAKALPLIKRTMENLPLERKFGVVLDVPIVADIKVGSCWGEARQLTAEQIENYRRSC